MGSYKNPDTNLLTATGTLANYKRQNASARKHFIRFGVCAAFLAIVTGLIFNANADYVLISSLLILISVIPVSEIVTAKVARFAYRRKRARVRSLHTRGSTFNATYDQANANVTIAGKKVGPGLLGELELFIAACGSVAKIDSLLPKSHKPHDEYVYSYTNGVTVSIVEYGHKRNLYAFAYGPTSSILQLSSDLWELGHVRGIKSADKTYFNTAKRSSGATALGFAYQVLPMNQDIKSFKKSDFSEMTFLGTAWFETPRENGVRFESNVETNLKIASQLSSIVKSALLAISISSFIATLFIGTPPLFAVVHVLLFRLFIEAPTISSIVWDDIANKFHSHKTFALVWPGIFMATASLLAAWFYLGQQSVMLSDLSFGSSAYAGVAVTIVTSLSFCLLVASLLLRQGSLKNIFFGLSSAIALLILALALYIEPVSSSLGFINLEAETLLYIVTFTGMFAIATYTHLHAGKYHSRNSLVELLQR